MVADNSHGLWICRLTIRHLVRSRGEDAAAAEGLGLEAGHARVEVGRALGTSVLVLNLLLGRDGHVEEELGRHNAASGEKDRRVSGRS